MMPVVFGLRLFGPSELFSKSQNVGKLIDQYLAGAECEAGIWCSPSYNNNLFIFILWNPLFILLNVLFYDCVGILLYSKC